MVHGGTLPCCGWRQSTIKYPVRLNQRGAYKQWSVLYNGLSLTAHALMLLWHPDRRHTLCNDLKKKSQFSFFYYLLFLCLLSRLSGRLCEQLYNSYIYICASTFVHTLCVRCTFVCCSSTLLISYFILNLMDECQRFFTALSVLPGNNLDISAHRFPNFS